MLPSSVNNHTESIKMTSGGFCHLIRYTLSFQLALIMKRTEAVSVGACDQYNNMYTWQDCTYRRNIKALRFKCWEEESERRNVLAKVIVPASGVFVRLICFSFQCTQYVFDLIGKRKPFVVFHISAIYILMAIFFISFFGNRSLLYKFAHSLYFLCVWAHFGLGLHPNVDSGFDSWKWNNMLNQFLCPTANTNKKYDVPLREWLHLKDMVDWVSFIRESSCFNLNHMFIYDSHR